MEPGHLHVANKSNLLGTTNRTTWNEDATVIISGHVHRLPKIREEPHYHRRTYRQTFEESSVKLHWDTNRISLNELWCLQNTTRITTDSCITSGRRTLRPGNRKKRWTNRMRFLSETFIKKASAYWILRKNLDRQRVQLRQNRKRLLSSHLGSTLPSKIPGRNRPHITVRQRAFEMTLGIKSYPKSSTLGTTTPRVRLWRGIPNGT